MLKLGIVITFLKKKLIPLMPAQLTGGQFNFWLANSSLMMMCYIKDPDNVLLICVDAKEANEVVLEVHEGAYSPHMSGHILARNTSDGLLLVYYEK